MDNLTGKKADEADRICDLENAEDENTIAFLLRLYDEAKAESDSLYSEAPCPECGATITGGCWGCLLKASQERCAKLEAALANAIEANHNNLAMASDFNEHRKTSWKECRSVGCAQRRAALASPSEPAGGRKD